jgi:hypothetical protein
MAQVEVSKIWFHRSNVKDMVSSIETTSATALNMSKRGAPSLTFVSKILHEHYVLQAYVKEDDDRLNVL